MATILRQFLKSDDFQPTETGRNIERIVSRQLSRSPRMNCSTQRYASSSVIWTGGCLEKYAEGECSTPPMPRSRSEEHTSELQSRRDLVCRLLLEKKNE